MATPAPTRDPESPDFVPTGTSEAAEFLGSRVCSGVCEAMELIIDVMLLSLCSIVADASSFSISLLVTSVPNAGSEVGLGDPPDADDASAMDVGETSPLAEVMALPFLLLDACIPVVAAAAAATPVGLPATAPAAST